MDRIYDKQHRIRFTEITEKYKVPKSLKGQLSAMHSYVIEYMVNNFNNTKKMKQEAVRALNTITYALLSGDALPFNWYKDHPLDNIPYVNPDSIESTLSTWYLTVDSIEWDIEPATYDIDNPSKSLEKSSSEKDSNAIEASTTVLKQHASKQKKSAIKNKEIVIAPTPKQDLYIQSPTIPQFDYNKPWMRGVDGADLLVIYTTLPEVPTKQNEISVTTDVNKMTYKELMNLYPNHLIHTRASIMYEFHEGLEYDDDLGVILPIEGFTKEQVIDNIIKYPHIFKLTRQVDDEIVSFYSHIEIEGELFDTLSVWDSLPESKVIPRQAEFVKEYVVRRYLLERDINHVEHKYPIFGVLDPFLTLFMSPEEYINRGYKDTEKIVKQCVTSRVLYKQSRNPVIRRLQRNAKLHI